MDYKVAILTIVLNLVSSAIWNGLGAIKRKLR